MQKKQKRKGITLKVSSSKKDHKESSSDDKDVENLGLMVKKFGKFLKRSKDRKFSKPSKKGKATTTHSHALNAGSKATSNLIVPSTLKNNLLRRKERRIENRKMPT